ncbi:protein of unknown function [Cupriavidus taiwanensis]|uniref:Uncharacterized protein n=1 Tax=Cupriavidus taiwanensis TaxID=164546 RepID=A0A375IJH5_9BURK|nr:protein of unknown function [Cupriavidus taiwanensis]
MTGKVGHSRHHFLVVRATVRKEVGTFAMKRVPAVLKHCIREISRDVRHISEPKDLKHNLVRFVQDLHLKIAARGGGLPSAIVVLQCWQPS